MDYSKVRLDELRSVHWSKRTQGEQREINELMNEIVPKEEERIAKAKADCLAAFNEAAKSYFCDKENASNLEQTANALRMKGGYLCAQFMKSVSEGLCIVEPIFELNNIKDLMERRLDYWTGEIKRGRNPEELFAPGRRSHWAYIKGLDGSDIIACHECLTEVNSEVPICPVCGCLNIKDLEDEIEGVVKIEGVEMPEELKEKEE